jgi:hypothetical protein
MARAASTPYTLTDVEAAHRTSHSRFAIPNARARKGVRVGHWVKLCFELPAPAPDGVIEERMWVRVQERRGDRYRGTLDNEPTHITGLVHGDVVTFGPQHIFDIAKNARKRDPVQEFLLSRAIVSRRVYGEGARPGALFRDEPVAEGDSGWQILAGDEEQAYLEDADNLASIPLGMIVQQHPDLIELLTAPPGSAWDWDEEKREYAAVDGGDDT